jgi:glycosyltransferase involved in cell wall biosynthesis
MRRGFEAARACFFVSEHNLRLTEQQIGARIPEAELVRNPFNVPWGEPQPWPAGEEGFRLGCVGRINILEKGQDLLLRVLASEKWRSRPVSLTVLGDGEQRRGLEAMAAGLALANVRFAGQTDDIPGFWRAHHALVLPSRAEGLPLVLVEAMLSARPAIVTDVGGNAELLDDGLTGFIADGATEKSLDAALERAWARRHDWPAIGAAAAAYARTVIPSDPAAVFAGRLLALAGAARAAPANPRRLRGRAWRVRRRAGALEE